MKAKMLNSSKRLLSFLICGAVIAGAIPVSNGIVSAEVINEYDTSIFAGNAEYLLEEHFAQHVDADVNGGYKESRLSGWDIDYRGRRAKIINNALTILDNSNTERVSLKHQILTVKSGSITFETALAFENSNGSRFTAQLGDGINSLMRLDFTEGNIYYGNTSLGEYTSGQKIYIKVDINLNTKSVKLYLNNQLKNLTLSGSAREIKEVSFFTGDAEVCTVYLYYVNAYTNYIVNERFLSSDLGTVPCDFTLSQSGTASGIAYAPGSAYADDKNGFLLENTVEVPDIELSKSFENINPKTVVEWSMLLPKKQDGVKVGLKSNGNEVISVVTSNGSICTGVQNAKADYKENLWHKFQIEIDAVAKTYDLKINYKTVVQDEPYSGEIVNAISFSKDSTANGSIILDDISVSKSFEKYADYPSEPQVTKSADTNVGMVMYPMWREGMHFGWDTISPYADEREPLMGYYTEGQREVADWQNKWMAEHGVDFALYPFVRPNSAEGEPVKKPARGEDLHDGYLNSEYSDNLSFAVFLSAYSTGTDTSLGNCHGVEEFIENVIPYLSEYYFSDPRYKVINGKLPIFTHSLRSMCDSLGGTVGVKSIIQALRSEAEALGFDDIIFCADAAGDTGHSLVAEIGEPIRIWSYTSSTDNADYIMEKTREEYAYSSQYIPSISMGYDTTPWRESKMGMMSPEELRSICEGVKNETAYQNSTEKMLLFTCWNEYGEGHYFAPSTKDGFGFLNVIRDEFTENGVNSDEERPSAKSIARMEALYPNGRKALKVKQDMKFSAEDLQNRESLYKYTFSYSDSLYWTGQRCTLSYNSTNSTLECTVTANDPYVARNNITTEVDISKVKAIRIKAYTKGVHKLKLLYTTSNNTTYVSGQSFTAERISGTENYDEYIMYPDTANPVPTGNITGFRFDPAGNIYDKGAKFGIAEFELYGDTTYEKFEIDDIDAQLTSAPIKDGDDTYIPVYSLLLNEMKAYPIWDDVTKTLTVYKDGSCIIFKADSSTVMIDGNEHTITAPIFNNGNLFIPYDEFFAIMNYSVNEEAGTVICTRNVPENDFDISVSAIGYGENMMIDYASSESSDFNLYNLTTPTTTTVDGKTALVLEPTGTTAIFSAVKVNSGGNKVSLDSVVEKGGKMKVSFLYKGKCTGMSVENRPASGTIEEKVSIPSVSETDWNSFEYVFDNSIAAAATSRWLSIRVTSAEDSNPKVYIADFKIQCQELVDDSFIAGNGISVNVTAPTNQAYGYNYDVMAAEYNTDNALVNCSRLYSGNTKSAEGGTNQTYTPQIGSIVKFFVWNNMRPLCELKTLTEQ